MKEIIEITAMILVEIVMIWILILIVGYLILAISDSWKDG